MSMYKEDNVHFILPQWGFQRLTLIKLIYFEFSWGVVVITQKSEDSTANWDYITEAMKGIQGYMNNIIIIIWIIVPLKEFYINTG